MGTFRLTALVVILVLAVITIAQNTESVTTKFLFISIEMPHALLLLLTLIVGALLGILGSAYIRHAARKKAEHSTSG